MTFEEFKQRHEENLDYLIEQLEVNVMDVDAYHYFNVRGNEINTQFSSNVFHSIINGDTL